MCSSCMSAGSSDERLLATEGLESNEYLHVLSIEVLWWCTEEPGDESFAVRWYCLECHVEKPVMLDMLAVDSTGDADFMCAVEGCCSGDFEITYHGSTFCSY